MPKPIWVGAKLGWAKGSKVKLLINDRVQAFPVAGGLPIARQDIGEGRTIVADIGLAQSVTGNLGRVDAIDTTLPKDADGAQWVLLLQKEVPPGVTVQRV